MKTIPRRSVALVFDQPCLNLELHGRNGLAWYVVDGGVLYAQTAFSADPENLLRLAAEVRLTPCDAGGHAQGARVTARARLAWETEAERARRLVRRKYGWLRQMWLEFRARLGNKRLAWVAIHLR
jgi:PPOX class probable F420-dependent enzyme